MMFDLIVRISNRLLVVGNVNYVTLVWWNRSLTIETDKLHDLVQKRIAKRRRATNAKRN